MSGNDVRAAAAEFLAKSYDMTLRDDDVHVVQICVPLHARPTAANPLPMQHIERHTFNVFDVIELLQAERKQNERLIRKLNKLESMLVNATADMRRLINGEDPA